MARINQKGTSLVEAVIALPFLILVITSVAFVVYLCVAQAWLHDSAEEAALCVAEKTSTQNCKNELRRKTALALPVGDYVRLGVRSSQSRVVVNYSFRIANMNLENEITLKLPVTRAAR